jgi:hypothetical protein
MWSVFANGSWHSVGDEAALVERARSGGLQPDSIVHHSSEPSPAAASQVGFLRPIFAVTMRNEQAHIARAWGIGSLFCGFAAPFAVIHGIIGYRQIKASPGRYANLSDAKIGMGLGGLSVLLMAFWVLRLGGLTNPPRETPVSPPSAVRAGNSPARGVPAPTISGRDASVL